LGRDLVHVAGTTEDTYQSVYRELCTNILASTDETLIGELEGLDVYLDVFAHNGAAPPVPVDNASLSATNSFANTQFLTVVYALKKKSSAACS